jgi:hypothetical protein
MRCLIGMEGWWYMRYFGSDILLSIALVLSSNDADSGCESHDSSSETHLELGSESRSSVGFWYRFTVGTRPIVSRLILSRVKGPQSE